MASDYTGPTSTWVHNEITLLGKLLILFGFCLIYLYNDIAIHNALQGSFF